MAWNTLIIDILIIKYLPFRIIVLACSLIHLFAHKNLNIKIIQKNLTKQNTIYAV